MNPPIMNNSDTITLASIINAECGGCSEREMVLVGLVVLNRLHSGEFPNSLHYVLNEENQFAGVNNTMYKPTEKTYNIAVKLLKNYSSISNGKYKAIKYFYHPDKATDRDFIKSMRNRILFKEREHYYCR